jgi:hypothetical protein
MPPVPRKTRWRALGSAGSVSAWTLIFISSSSVTAICGSMTVSGGGD